MRPSCGQKSERVKRVSNSQTRREGDLDSFLCTGGPSFDPGRARLGSLARRSGAARIIRWMGAKPEGFDVLDPAGVPNEVGARDDLPWLRLESPLTAFVKSVPVELIERGCVDERQMEHPLFERQLTDALEVGRIKQRR